MKGNRIVGCGIVAAVLIVVLVVVAHVAITRPGRTVRAEIARIKAEGSPVTLEDMIGPKVPDARNGALILKKALAMLSTESAKKDIAFAARAIDPREPITTPEDWKKLRTVLEKYKNIFPIVEKAVGKPDCRFPVDYSNGAVEALFPHFARVRDLTRVICAKSVLDAHDGKSSDACQDIGLVFRVCKLLERDRITEIGFLVNVADLRMAYGALQSCVADGDIPEAAASRLSGELASLDLGDMLIRGLGMDRAEVIDIYNRVLKHGPQYVDYVAGSIHKMKSFHPSSAFTKRVLAEELYYLNKRRAQILVAGEPCRVVAGNKEIDRPNDIPEGSIVANICLRPVSMPMRTRDRAQAQINISRIALALSVYHGKHKTYPATLKEIADFFGGKLPIDPFSGKGFVYQQGMGYVLYSIGPNLVDDNGQDSSRKYPADDGDIVWRMK